MSDIEKRARELLARLQKAKRNEAGHWCDARAANDAACEILPQIIVALTPPEGYVLVPVEPTRQMQVAALEGEWNRATPAEVWAAMLAARPEVKGD